MECCVVNTAYSYFKKGTGKTTTLVKLTERHPEMRFLNVCYNKYQGQLAGCFRIQNITRCLSKDTTFLHAQRVVKALSSFIASSRPSISIIDVDDCPPIEGSVKSTIYFNSKQYKEIVVRDALICWGKMIDENDKNLYMTHDGKDEWYRFSFRFGPEIAYVANSLLECLKDVHHKTLMGNPRSGSVMGERSGQLAIICRTNFCLFQEAVRVCQSGRNIRISFAGGLKSYQLDRVLSIYKLFKGEYVDDPFLRQFTFSTLRKYAHDAADKVLLGKIKIVESFNVNVPAHIKAITSLATDQMECAVENPEDEKNMLYVAVTRAKTCLQINNTIKDVLESNKFNRGVREESAAGVVCITCAMEKVPHFGCFVDPDLPLPTKKKNKKKKSKKYEEEQES
ncbi:hypothetical protein QZH41_005272 [Actinostola sp. cb2023]|nr:hypothetical protein QZH41_005272 [Actinostola sp. cb2023]